MPKEKVLCKAQTSTGLHCMKQPVLSDGFCHYHTPAYNNRCVYITGTGEQCKRPALFGLSVCSSHNARAPQTLNAAKRRLAQLMVPAIDALEQALQHGDWPVVAKVALGILDRGGLGPKATLSVEEKERRLSELSREELQARARAVFEALDKAKVAAAQAEIEATAEPTDATDAPYLALPPGDESGDSMSQ